MTNNYFDLPREQWWIRDRYILLSAAAIFVVQLLTLRPPIVIGEPYFIAENMLHGLGYAYAYPGQPVPEITAYIPPLYAFFSYALLSIFDSVVLLQVVNLVFLQVAVYVLYRFALNSIGRPGAIVTFAAASIYLPFWLLAEAAEPNALNLLLIILTVDRLYSLRTNYQHWKSWAVLGTLVGLQILVRPDMLLGAVMFAFWLLWSAPASARKPLRGVIAKTALVAVIIAVPWTIRNWVVFHQFIPVSANAGYNLFLGNNPWATGEFAQAPGADFSGPESYLKGHSAIEQDRHYRDVALDWMAANPGKTLVLAGRKFYYHWWHRARSGGNMQIGSYQVLFDISTALLLLGGFVGLFLIRDKALRSLLLTLFLYSSLISMIFFVQSRHRILKVDPFLIMLASFAAVHVWQDARGKNNRLAEGSHAKV